MYKPALITGTILGGLAVALGAMGAHAVKAMVSPERLEIYNKAAQYHFYHVFAIIACGILYSAFPVQAIRTSFICFVLGILFFSGSLYCMTFVKGDLKELGLVNLITPLGGVMFIAGWLFLLIGLLKKS